MKLELRDICKSYGKNLALQGVSATLEDGVYGLLGPNGAGKTTLLGILTGILPSSPGTILVDGCDVRELGRNYFDLIGYMPQYSQFYGNFTVTEFLSYMCQVKGVKDAPSRIEEVLVLVNLYDQRKKRVEALSGGMRQRLGIAQAIVNNPKLLVLDEPTAGLDPGERVRFRNLLSKLAGGRIILLATHIVSDVACIAREILLLQRGQLVMQGPPSQLEQRIQGRVWQLRADRDTALTLGDAYCVSNMRQEGDQFWLRILSNTPPLPEAVPVQPNLEDVFLYTFFPLGEESL